MLLGVFAGDLAASWALGLSALVALPLAVGDTLEPLIATVLFTTFAVQPWNPRARDVFVFVFCTLVACGLSAASGTLWLSRAGEIPIRETFAAWGTYVTSTSTGMVLLAPTVLAVTAALRRFDRRRRQGRPIRASIARTLEATMLALLLVLISAQVFLGNRWEFAGLFTTFPLFLWATLRFGAVGATTSATLVAAIAVWGTVRGESQISGLSASDTSTVLQLLVAVVVIANLTLAAVLAERDQARRDLQDTLDVLDEAEQLALVGGWMLDVPPQHLDPRAHVWCTSELRSLLDLPEGDRSVTIGHMLETLDEDDRDALRDAIDTAVRDGGSFTLEHTVGHDGSRRAVRHVGRVVATQQREPDRLVGAVLDITSQRELDQMKDAFLTTTSHELRTPLTSILGFVQTLASSWRTLPDERRQQFLEIIADRAERMALIVDDTLLQARVDSGSTRADVEPLLVAPILERALHDVGRPATYQLDDARLQVLAQNEQLVHIVTNFLGNAMKYGSEPIEVSARRIPGDMVEIRVVDRGDGPDPAFVPRMFERFERGPGTSELTGTGLGLSIAEGLANAMGGSVGFRREGATSVFFVALPVAPTMPST